MALAPVPQVRKSVPGARVLRRLTAMASVLGLSACGPSAPAASGREGIVSLNPCTDAILAEVADPAQIRAFSAYSRDVASSSMDVSVAARFPSTTGTVEEIVALRPSVVVSGTFTPPATRQALARLGIKLIEIPIATTVDESLRQIDQLAALTGHRSRGAKLAQDIKTQLDAAQPSATQPGAAQPGGRAPIQALVWQSGGLVAGERTLITDLLRRTGFTNVAAARGLQQADYLPLEHVLADPPAVIFTSGDPSGEDRLLDHPALAALRGTERAKLDSRLLWCGGPTISLAARRLAEVRHAIIARRTRR